MTNRFNKAALLTGTMMAGAMVATPAMAQGTPDEPALEATQDASIDADDEPAGDIAAAISAVIDTARAEGREPTREEIEAAVSAIAGDAQSIDVEVLSTKG